MNLKQLVGMSPAVILMLFVFYTTLIGGGAAMGMAAQVNESVTLSQAHSDADNATTEAITSVKANMSKDEYALAKSQLSLVYPAMDAMKMSLSFGFEKPRAAKWYIRSLPAQWSAMGLLLFWPRIRKGILKLKRVKARL